MELYQPSQSFWLVWSGTVVESPLGSSITLRANYRAVVREDLLQRQLDLPLIQFGEPPGRPGRQSNERGGVSVLKD